MSSIFAAVDLTAIEAFVVAGMLILVAVGLAMGGGRVARKVIGAVTR